MIKLRTQTHLAGVGALAVAGITIAGLTAASLAPAHAQEFSPEVERIVKALGGMPEGKTRSFSINDSKPLSAKHRAVLEVIKKKGTRGLSLGERDELAEATETLPSIDLEVYFDFDSDQVNAGSQETVKALGQALTHSSFNGSTFIVAGHTDAKGGPDYNQKLSERRAAAVRRLLIEQYHLGESRLMAVGYGEEQLKNPSIPVADENRRVQIVNIGE